MIMLLIFFSRIWFIINFALVLNFKSSTGDTVISAHYEVTPAVGLVGLSCLTHHVEYNRAVRLHNTSGICEMLDADWNSSPIYESGFIYMKMLAYDRRFPQSLSINVDMPDDFGVDSSFKVVFRTERATYGWFHVVALDPILDTIYLKVQFRQNTNMTLIRSKQNKVWSSNVIAPLPFFTPHTDHTVTVYLRTTHWEIHLDSEFFYSYNHVYTFINTETSKAQFWSIGDVFCKGITFQWP